jgi:hypothetical protein
VHTQFSTFLASSLPGAVYEHGDPGGYAIAHAASITSERSASLEPVSRVSHLGPFIHVRVRVYPEFTSIARPSSPLARARGSLSEDETEFPIEPAIFGLAGMSRMSNSSWAAGLEAGWTSMSP